MNQPKLNILLFNMQTYADLENGIVNRNAFILRNLLKHRYVNKILAVDFIHFRKKRLLKDYYQSVFEATYAQRSIFQSFWSRCRSVKTSSGEDEKLFVYSTVNQLKDPALIVKELTMLLKRLDMNGNLVVWSYNPLYTGFFRAFGQRLDVFDTVDNWMTHSSHKHHKELLATNYKKISHEADVIFTVSENLVDFYKTFHRVKDVFHIPNGVDLDIFQKTTLEAKFSEAFKKIPHPRLGYLGSITQDRVDIDLIAYIAKNNPDKSVVLAGPVWKGLRHEVQRKLLWCHNVSMLGRIPYQQTPAVMDQFDVCLNPHQFSNFIRYTDPMKIYEYLALGKPVVSSANEGLEKYQDLIYLCSTRRDFHDKIKLALHEDDPHRLCSMRMQWASQNSYQSRVDQMIEIIFKNFSINFADETLLDRFQTQHHS